MSHKTGVAILGASGYTGAELLRLLLPHPLVRVVMMTGDRSAGKPISSVFPQFIGYDLPDLVALPEASQLNRAETWAGVDLVFCALPHGTTQEIIRALPPHLRIIDLSADFRLRDPASYAEWYGHEHRATELQKSAVYGLTEVNRERIKTARLVANPGCYPTAAQLPLIPLLQAGLIARDGIIIDAKSGVSGAGRAAKEASLFCEVAGGIAAYGVASHRHTPEIEQGLSDAAQEPIEVSFTPHLMPMSRGILATIFVEMKGGLRASDLKQKLIETYRAERFVLVAADDQLPSTRFVLGTNRCLVNVFADRLKGRAIIISVIDNLVKGASGQAIQNMNLMLGYPESLSLDQPALFP
ncbi:MAG: N-acetyl-gamma-glutamyl-phosphate reductase [Candidatus Pacebacteria bacterium]|nr:N-acetyl-gamma-glutamyl-phosphate reductase [Candidatus Paceibacterota bacterium]